jgi:hypothetical protein
VDVNALIMVLGFLSLMRGSRSSSAEAPRYQCLSGRISVVGVRWDGILGNAVYEQARRTCSYASEYWMDGSYRGGH